MKYLNITKIAVLFLITATVAGILSSCNSKEEGSEPEYEPSVSVAVKSFKLNPDARVMTDLDSVFFSIDLDHGIIFNADSLPVGTNIERLIPVITYPSAVESATILMEGGKRRTGTVDYTKNPSDTIDFSGKVTLTLTAEKGELSRSYQIRINVHQSKADSLMWDKVAVSPLPSRLAEPLEQKTVSFNGRTICIVRESDNSLTLSTTGDISEAVWRRESLGLPFAPQISTLCAADNALYILSEDGRLFTSTDAAYWTDTNVAWTAMLGGYGGHVLGIQTGSDGSHRHDIYPRPADYTQTAVDPEFPLSGYSNMLTFSSAWADMPYAFITGGKRDGKALNKTWAFDGATWADISDNPLPALSDALIIPYFVYRKTSTAWIQTEYAVTLCLGGTKSDGALNRTVYLSYDNGVNWKEAESLLQLPDFIPALRSADAVIATTSMQGSLTNWTTKSTPRPHGYRLQYFVDGSQVDWECPYIYMIGGIDSAGRLSPEIRRAVLARLTFTPLF